MIFSGLLPLVWMRLPMRVNGSGFRCGPGQVRSLARIVVPARCGYAYHDRLVDDVPIDARRVLAVVRVRRLVCAADGCGRTFREQVPGVLERYQRRTTRLAGQIGVVVRELAGRGSVRLLSAMAVRMSRQSAIRILRRLYPGSRRRRSPADLATTPRPAPLSSACPEMIDLAGLIGSFATVLRSRTGNDTRLDEWIITARAADLPHVHALTRGLDHDPDAVNADLTLPYHNGGTERVNTKTKRIMRQMHGRANFDLLRHRILVGKPDPNQAHHRK